MQKLVSVIIPTFDRAHSIVEAIESVKKQTYSAVQIIIIDDGSHDNTAQIVAKFDGVEYYYQKNRGQAAARNLGLKYARGEYIASLDSDDIWGTDFLTNSVKCLEKHDLDFVFLNWTSSNGKENFVNFWQRNKKWKKYTTKSDDDWFFIDSKQLRQLFLIACPSPSSSLLLRRKSMQVKWNEEMIAADDWFLMLEIIISKPCRAAFTTVPHWIKRVFGDNVYDGRNALEVTQNSLHDDLLMAQYLESKLNTAEKMIFRRRLALNYLGLGRLKWKNENISKNLFLNLIKAFSLAPFGVSSHIMMMFVDHIKCRLKTTPTTAEQLKKQTND